MYHPPFRSLSATSASGSANEDRAGTGSAFAWMLDGATGLSGERHLPGPTDAAWFAAAWSDTLEELAPRHQSVKTLLIDAHLQVRERLGSILGNVELSTGQMPALALSLIHVDNGILSTANVGDCSVLLKPADGVAFRIGCSEVDRFDDLALAVLKQGFANGLTYNAASAQAKRQILTNRLSANVSGGYWVVDPTDRWIEHIQFANVPLVDDARVLLASDGFMRILDTYRVVGNYDALFELVHATGLDEVICEVRAIEAADPECRCHPRLKPSDDATALMLWLAAPNAPSRQRIPLENIRQVRGAHK